MRRYFACGRKYERKFYKIFHRDLFSDFLAIKLTKYIVIWEYCYIMLAKFTIINLCIKNGVPNHKNFQYRV